MCITLQVPALRSMSTSRVAMVGSVGVRDGAGQRLSLHGGSWMNAHDRLSHKWRELANRYGCETTCAEIVLDELLRAYSEPNRLYHAIDHIGSLLSQLEEHGNAVIDSDAVVLAILFHDVVYNPLRHDSEEKSAALAGERLAFLGFPGGVIAKVEQYINATKHAQDFVTADCYLAVLLDLDLSTLAAAPAEYRAYSQANRREYAHVPDELYRPGRRRFVEGFLERQLIYRTDQLHALWEERARANISGEIVELA
jgi:predicted metal-dependent HD superfamily phosphohydrolase